MRLKAFVLNSSDEVKWLVIESDETDTKGFFLYYYIKDNTAYDTWHKIINDAFEAAHMQYVLLKKIGRN